MDLGMFLILLIIFGVVSFFIEKFWGVNPYKAYLGIGAVTLFLSLLYIIYPVMNPPYNLDLSMSRLNNWINDFLPGAIVGDVAGVIISKITGGRQ